MYRFAIIFLALISFSQAALTDHLPSFLRSSNTSSPSLPDLLALHEVRDSIASQRNDFYSRANSGELRNLRLKINEQDRIIDSLTTKLDQRLNDIRRDFIGLRNDLRDRINLRQQDYKDAQERLKRQKAIIDFVSSWSKRYGILARNLIDIKNKLMDDYNEDLIKRFERSQNALLQANDELIANWKNEISDPEIQNLASEIKKHHIIRANLIKTLQQHLRALSFPLAKDPLSTLKAAIKQANCSAVKDPAQASDKNVSTCFVEAFTSNPPINQPACQTIIVPGARSNKQAIDPYRPLSDYLTCARAVIQTKPQKVQFKSTKRSADDILIDLDQNRKILEELSKTERKRTRELSGAAISVEQHEQEVKLAYEKYQESLTPLRQKLSSLSDQLETVIKISRQKLDVYIDQTHILQKDNTEITDALMEEDGADKLQNLIIGMLQKTATDKAKDLALWMLNKIKSADMLIRFDPKEIQSVLRKIIETARKDKALADQFKNSNILSQAMMNALNQLEDKYPDFKVREDILNVQDKYGIMATVCKVGAGVRDFAKAPISFAKDYLGEICSVFKAPNLSKNTDDQAYFSHKQQQGLKEQNQILDGLVASLGQAKSSLQALNYRADVTLSNVMADIKGLRCPYITGLNDLSDQSVEKCSAWVLSSIPQQTKDRFPSCYSWSTSGSLQCLKDQKLGRPVSSEVQLKILVNNLRVGLNARNVLDQADSIVRTAHSQINDLPNAYNQFNHALEKLAAFKDTWIKDKTLKIKELKSRQVETQSQYEKLSSKLRSIQEGWIQYLGWVSQLNDQAQVLMTMLTATTLAVNAKLDHPNLAQDVAKLNRLVHNLEKGLENLENNMINFENDTRYLRESKIPRAQFDFAKNSLFNLQTALQKSLKTADIGMAAVNDAIKNLGCKWFQNIGAGGPGLNKCMSAMADRVRQLGALLKKPECKKIDIKSPYLLTDLDQCSLKTVRAVAVNEGDLIKGGQIIRGMDGDNTDAMIHRLMEQGGYSRDQATNILKQMMIL